MQNYCKTIGALAAASALAAGIAQAEVNYELSTGYSSEYLWRGNILGQDMTELGFKASTEYQGLTYSAGAWYAQFDRNSMWNPGTFSYIKHDELDELNLFAEVSKEFSFADVAVGYIYYEKEGWAPAGENRELGEVYVRGTKNYQGVDFSLAYYCAVEGDSNGYTELGASKNFELSSQLNLKAGLVTAYLFETNDLAYIAGSLALEYKVTESVKLSPYVVYSLGTGNDDGLNYQNEVVAGSRLAVSF